MKASYENFKEYCQKIFVNYKKGATETLIVLGLASTMIGAPLILANSDESIDFSKIDPQYFIIKTHSGYILRKTNLPFQIDIVTNRNGIILEKICKAACVRPLGLAQSPLEITAEDSSIEKNLVEKLK